MLSRRKFLQANAAGLALPFAGASLRPAAPVTTEQKAAKATYQRDFWNDWPQYLTAKMQEARARRKAALAAITSPQQARVRAEMIRKKIWDLIGGPFEKTPLNPKITGTLERPAYRIEKVIFESQPEVYVTANLYVPTTSKPPFPAILSPLGHARNGKAYRNYQYVFQTLARMGYVVFAFDPFGQGERHQYLDPKTGRPRLGPTGEHSQAGRPLLLLGASFAQYRAWDGIRALDYLLSRSEVDPERVGCTGHSGGGTMTMYLCALEPRLKVAVEVEGNSENLAGPQYSPPGAIADAEQNLIGSLAVGLDRGDLLAAFAPKPLLICYTPQDGGTTYSPVHEEATREIFSELKRLYGILGAQEKVGIFASPFPHDFGFPNRRATYDWFNRWLGKSELKMEEAEFDHLPEGSLNCTSTGEVLTALGGRSVVQINTEQMRAVAPTGAQVRTAEGAPAAREKIRSTLRSLLALPSERAPLKPAVLSRTLGQGLIFEEFVFHSESEVRIPGWFVKPEDRTGRLPTVVYVSEHGRNGIVHETSEWHSLARRGYAVCAIDLRGLGISTPHYPTAGPLFYGYDDPDIQSGYAWACLTLGKPVVGQRVWDFLRTLDYLETRTDVDHAKLDVYGFGGGALAALMGTALDDRPHSILLESVLADFRSVVESEDYTLRLGWFVFGILRQLDMPDLVAAVAPRACWMVNAVGADGKPLPKLAMENRYQEARNLYSALGVEQRLRIVVRPDQERATLLADWLGRCPS